jgi:hypothetical protein
MMGATKMGGGPKTMIVRLTALLAVLAFASAGLLGCSNVNSEGNFTKKIDKVRPGMTQSEVHDALGAPDRRGGGVVEPQPTGGSGSALVGAVPAGSRYEDWYYDRKGTHYHVLFAASTLHPGRWEVVRTTATPAGATVGGADPVPPPR